MAKKLYININSVNKQIKKLYADIGDGTYKKIKKLYAAINGYYKQTFGGGELVYRGLGIVALPSARNYLATEKTKNHALCIGGTYSLSANDEAKDVYAIDKDLTVTTAPKLEMPYVGTGYLAAHGAISGCAIIAEYYNEKLYCYDENLTRSYLMDVNSTFGVGITDKGINTANHLIFPCSKYNTSGSAKYRYIAMNEDFTSSMTELSGISLHGVHFNGYAVLHDNSNNIRTMDDNFTVTIVSTELRVYNGNYRSAEKLPIKNHLLFGGGQVEVYDEEGDYYQVTHMVDIFDTNWTHTIGTDLNFTNGGRTPLSLCMGEFGIFAVGYDNRAIRAYDTELTVVLEQEAEYERGLTEGVMIGDHGLFPGGKISYMNKGSYYATDSIELFSIQ